MPSRNPMPRLCAASSHIKHHGIRSPRNPNAWSAKMSSALQPIPSSIPLPNFLSTPKEPFVSAWKRLWSSYHHDFPDDPAPTPAAAKINAALWKTRAWGSVGFLHSCEGSGAPAAAAATPSSNTGPFASPIPPIHTQDGVAGRLYAGRRCTQKTLSSKK